MESFVEGLRLRSLEMLAHREMKNFPSAQKRSNDRIPSQHSISPFIEGMGVHWMP